MRVLLVLFFSAAMAVAQCAGPVNNQSSKPADATKTAAKKMGCCGDGASCCAQMSKKDDGNQGGCCGGSAEGSGGAMCSRKAHKSEGSKSKPDTAAPKK